MSPAFYLMLPLLPAALIIQLCTHRTSATIISTGESDGVPLQCFAANNSTLGALCPKYFRFFQPPKGCCGRLIRKHPNPHSYYLGQIKVSAFEASLIDGEAEGGERESVRVEEIDLNKRLTQILRNITNSIRTFSRIRGSTKRKKTTAPDTDAAAITTTSIATTTAATTTVITKSSTTDEGLSTTAKPVGKLRPSPHSGEEETEITGPSTVIEEKPREHKVRPPPPIDEGNGDSNHRGRGKSTAHKTTTSRPNTSGEANTLVVDSKGRAILPVRTKIIYCTVARFRKGQPVCPRDHPYDLKRALCCGPTPIKTTPHDVNDIVEPARPTTPRPKPPRIPDYKRLPSTTSQTKIPEFIAMDCVDFVQPGKLTSDCPSNKEKCNDPKWYRLMSKICPKTCKRCEKHIAPWPVVKGGRGGKGRTLTGWLRGYPSSLTMLLKRNTSICLDGVTMDGKSSECGTFSHRCKTPVWDLFMSAECPVTCGTCGHFLSLSDSSNILHSQQQQ